MISHQYLNPQKSTHPPSGCVGHIVAVFQIVAALAGNQGFAEAAGFQSRQVVFGAVNLVRLIQFFGTGGQICYDFLKPRIIARKPITIALIKETHAILTAGTYDENRYIQQGERPGAFKKHDYVTGIEEVGSLPEDVEHDMQELLATLQELAGKDPLKIATYFHVRFEYIHPFADGNGRVGRTLLNYLLMTRDHPPLIVYDEDKRDYYAALEEYDRNEDYQPMYAFLKRETIRTWEKALARDRQRTQREG